jgi:HlyD family secretion protein
MRSAEASLKESTENLSKTTITAPVNGKIIKLNVESGERVVGTSQMSGTEMMVLASSNEMEVSVDVNENDIIRVHLNDTSLIEVDAYSNRKFKGIVTEIANSANTTGASADQVTNFVVKIRMLQSSYLDLTNPFRRGMSATVDIQTKHAHQVITVPIQAVTTRSDSADSKESTKKEEGESEDAKVVEDKKQVKEVKKEVKEYVFILSDGQAKQVEVKAGIQDNTYIELISGIKEGQEIISGPYTAVSKLLKNGSPVKITKTPAGGKPK